MPDGTMLTKSANLGNGRFFVYVTDARCWLLDAGWWMLGLEVQGSGFGGWRCTSNLSC